MSAAAVTHRPARTDSDVITATSDDPLISGTEGQYCDSYPETSLCREVTVIRERLRPPGRPGVRGHQGRLPRPGSGVRPGVPADGLGAVQRGRSAARRAERGRDGPGRAGRGGRAVAGGVAVRAGIRCGTPSP